MGNEKHAGREGKQWKEDHKNQLIKDVNKKIEKKAIKQSKVACIYLFSMHAEHESMI